MMNEVIYIIVSIIILFGMLLLMCGIVESQKLLKGKKIQEKVGVLAFAIVILTIFYKINVPVLLLVIIEYIVLVYASNNRSGQFYAPAIKGIVCLLAMAGAEIVVYTFYYERSEKMQQISQGYADKVMLICVMQMAMAQYIFTTLIEIMRLKNDYRSVLLCMLVIKTIEEIYWMYSSVGCLSQSKQCVLTVIVFVISLLLDYTALFILLLRMEESDERKKRADIHVNTYEYYVHMEEEHLLIRQLYHDMKNQIMIMKTEQEQNPEAMNQYIQAVDEKLDTMNQYYHTGQTTLDIILFDARKRAELKGIEFDAVVSEGCLSFMEEEDLSIIFTNAIVNALEACDKITDGPKKIEVKAGRNLNDVLIYFKNTVSRERKKGSLVSGKKNGRLHGIGLSSIQKSADKYQGYVSISEEDHMFQLAILFVRE